MHANRGGSAEESELTAVFAALSNPTRLAIVTRLMSTGEVTLSELLDEFSMSAPAISRHIKVLVQAGVLSRRVDRSTRPLSLRLDTLERISAFLEARGPHQPTRPPAQRKEAHR